MIHATRTHTTAVPISLIGRPSRTPAPTAGPSTLQTVPSRFSLLQEMLEEDDQWNSDDSSCSGHSAYDFNYDSDGDNTVASTMLPTFASGGKKKSKKKKGKGKKAPAPKMITSSGVSKTPQQQQRLAPEEVFTDEGQKEEMPIEIVEELVGKAFISVMDGHFAKLYSKIDNLKTEVSTLKTTVASLVEENKKLGEVRRHAPDPEMQQQMTPRTSKKDLTIRPHPQLQPRKQVGTPFAREILTRNWQKQVKKDNTTPMNIDESDAEPGRPGKAPRLTSLPPTLMHSRYAGASAMVKRREDDRGENDKGGWTRSLPNPQEQ